ncbi:MAG: hypothetical protein KDA33_09580 [Phycisphaerales bacterium]|nr:hypothetical protein [Phycisphaerales bacterium]
MMQANVRRWMGWTCLIALTAMCFAGCDAVSGLFQRGVTVVVQNDTGFTATPDIRMSDSRNILEDAFSDPQSVSDGASAVAPYQTATIHLDCDGQLELITFEGARFRDGAGFSFGDADADKAWRRDVDFDCGDTIRIRLSGTVFFFDAATSVERSAPIGSSCGAIVVEEGDEDIGQLIDQLLGS